MYAKDRDSVGTDEKVTILTSSTVPAWFFLSRRKDRLGKC